MHFRAAIAACLAGLSLAAAGPDDQIFLPGTKLISPTGRTKLAIQKDANLVLYHSVGGDTLWASNTPGQVFAHVRMQYDGNLVAYGRSGLDAVYGYWSSGTGRVGKPPFTLAVQDDANVVIYDGTGKATWSTNTWSRGHFSRVMFHNEARGMVIYPLIMNALGSQALWRRGSCWSMPDANRKTVDLDIDVDNNQNRVIGDNLGDGRLVRLGVEAWPDDLDWTVPFFEYRKGSNITLGIRRNGGFGNGDVEWNYDLAAI